MFAKRPSRTTVDSSLRRGKMIFSRDLMSSLSAKTLQISWIETATLCLTFSEESWDSKTKVSMSVYLNFSAPRRMEIPGRLYATISRSSSFG